MENIMKFISDFFANLKGSLLTNVLIWVVFVAAILGIFVYVLDIVSRKRGKKEHSLNEKVKKPQKDATKKEQKADSKKVEPAKTEAVSAAVAEEKPATVADAPKTKTEDVDKDVELSQSMYVSPLIIDRTKYEIALQEKLQREEKERRDREAMETARLEMLKNKEFQSHAGFISTLQRFNKKDTLESQLANEGKVDKELLNTYLQEKGTTISEEFTNMSPELKAVILSDLMNRKY